MSFSLPLARPFARVLLAASLGLSVSGCWGVGDGLITGGIAAPSPQVGLGRNPTLLVATTRKSVEGRPWFGSERGRGLTFAEARLEAPDESLMGRVSTLGLGGWSIGSVEKKQSGEGAAAAFAQAAMGRDVLIYVHGYREGFDTAAISAAQLSSGIGFGGASGLFTWPSGAATFDYGYDRESAMWSRDALEDLLRALAESGSGGRIHIVAHSMGTLLTLETLRMLRGGDSAMARIGAVVLAAPDIDFDLFKRGLERLGPDAKKITVISSTNDRALELSSRIAGGVVRAGAADREKLAALGVRVADASEYGSGLGLINHDLFLTNPEVQQVVKRAIERSGGG